MTEHNDEPTDREWDEGINPKCHVREYPMHSRLPTTHTIDAHSLRCVNKMIDALAFHAERYRAVLPQTITDQIDYLSSAWQPIRDELARQHVAHVHSTKGASDE